VKKKGNMSNPHEKGGQKEKKAIFVKSLEEKWGKKTEGRQPSQGGISITKKALSRGGVGGGEEKKAKRMWFLEGGERQ